MKEEIKAKLRFLADKYEVASFCNEDPSQFLRWYQPPRGSIADIEISSFIAAMLSFGSRKQFIPKIKQILEKSDNSSGSITCWLKSKKYKVDFPTGTNKFYRFYSFDDMHSFFDELAEILKTNDSLGSFLYNKNKKSQNFDTNLSEIISSSFPKSSIVPKGHNSTNKRIHMFLRWMIRRNSPVDLGLWQWASPEKLIIPLDVHVMQEAIKLGLLSENAKPSRKTAELLTASLSEVFPGDPCRGDYALFGLGVDSEKQ